MLAYLLTCLLAALSARNAPGQAKAIQCSHCAEWNFPQKPFRIFGNTYYVGTHSLSSILITTPAGNILIDGALPQSAPQIVANLHSLGFQITDTKFILNSHVHFDHAGGIAELQRLSGARVLASPWSAAVLRHGGVGRNDPQFGSVLPIARVKNVQELGDGTVVRLEDVSITAHLTPGHTPGGTSWTWKSCEGNVCYDMVYADSLTAISSDEFRFTNSGKYPRALEDFEKSITFLDSTPCGILITVHPEVSRLWDRLAARENGAKPDPMVNPSACRELAADSRAQLRQRVAQEQAGPVQKPN
jgi:metallo-beta-lactamase class B